MKFKLLLCSLVFASFTLNAQVRSDNFKSESWSIEKIDSKYDSNKESATSKIVAKYKPAVDSLLIPIGKSKQELRKYSPESPLSNFTADVIKYFASEYVKKNNIDAKVDVGLANFGGIRTSLPKGDITSYDVLSVYPFDNKVVIAQVSGKALKEMFGNFAKRGRIEALSGVELVIENRQIKKCLVNGEKIKDNNVYGVATIDFIYSGGDNVYALKNSLGLVETGTVLMDAIIGYIKEQTAQGKAIDPKTDGRIKITDNNSKK